MGTVYDALRGFFDDWFFMQNDEELFLKLVYEGRSGKFDCYAQAIEQPEQIVFYSVFPAKVPAEKRQMMAEMLARINYGLLQGCFEMDFGDGEIRFRTGLFAGETQLTDELIRPVVYLNLGMTDRYWPVLQATIEGGKTPAEALELARQEGDTQASDET